MLAPTAASAGARIVVSGGDIWEHPLEPGKASPGFQPSGLARDTTIFSMALQSDGKILIGGNFDSNRLVRGRIDLLNSDGSPDESFLGGGGSYQLHSMCQRNGTILTGGICVDSSMNATPLMIRLYGDGGSDRFVPPDLAFGFVAIGPVALLRDGKIIVGARPQNGTDYRGGYIARLWGD
jgi:hypothetical protein